MEWVLPRSPPRLLFMKVSTSVAGEPRRMRPCMVKEVQLTRYLASWLCFPDESNGATILRHDLFTNDVLYVEAAFELKTVPADLLPLLPLFW